MLERGERAIEPICHPLWEGCFALPHCAYIHALLYKVVEVAISNTTGMGASQHDFTVCPLLAPRARLTYTPLFSGN